jgi:hypothetical protein
MTLNRIVIAALIAVAGCDVNTSSDLSRSTSATAESPEKEAVAAMRLDQRLAKVDVGTPESDLVALLGELATDSGTVYWGGSGAKRMYFQITSTKQVWFEIGGSYDGDNSGKIVMVSPIEPKTKWVRHRGDSISVDRPTTRAH